MDSWDDGVDLRLLSDSLAGLSLNGDAQESLPAFYIPSGQQDDGDLDGHPSKDQVNAHLHRVGSPPERALCKAAPHEAQELEPQGCYRKALKIDEQSLEAGEKARDEINVKERVCKAHDDWFRNSSEGYYELPGPYRLPAHVYERLFPHQLEGVKWMWSLHGSVDMGGILGDDMGMGKTCTTIAYLYGLFVSGLVRHVLIVMPLGLLETWKTEFKSWFPDMRVRVFHGPAASIQKDLDIVLEKGGVLLTTYDKVRLSVSKLADDINHHWDYIILDEGHTIKNQNSQKAKAIRQVHARHRLLLSGTPIQNNMEELWSLFDYVCNGNLLSSKRKFMTHFGNHIRKGEARDATPEDKEMANKVAEALRSLISPYFLRREKATLVSSPAIQGSKIVQDEERTLSVKTEFAIWVSLTQTQLRLYEAFLTNLNLHEILNASKSPLSALNVLRKICDHPAMISHALQDCEDIDLDSIHGLDATSQALLEQSAKLSVTVQLVKELHEQGHRTLICSSSRVMLDVLEKCIAFAGLSLTRIDGGITDRKERQRRINMFNRDTSIDCFLLTTQVAIGITLTGADRVIMYEPSWNPKRDAQAVDRAYRVGQSRDVVVYRLLTCGTLEEKIYRNQIRKDYLARTAIESGRQARYFTQAELRDMFTLDDTSFSATEQYLSLRHPIKDRDCDYLMELDHVSGVSRHDQLYSSQDAEEPVIAAMQVERLAQDALRQFALAEHQVAPEQVHGTERLKGSIFRPPQLANDAWTRSLVRGASTASISSPVRFAIPVDVANHCGSPGPDSLPLGAEDADDRTNTEGSSIIILDHDRTSDSASAFHQNTAVPCHGSTPPRPLTDDLDDSPVAPTTRRKLHRKFVIMDSDSDSDSGLLTLKDGRRSTKNDTSPLSRLSLGQLDNKIADEESECIKPSSCPTHRHVSKIVAIRHCRCVQSDATMDKYDALLFRYRESMTKGQYRKALHSLQAALDICDDDSRVWFAHIFLTRMVE
ncbi:SNF2 family N-terminal domain-containing protein [Gaertneriomyces semiglobifer]|nr:SNF2 family N-terminal domain-containing protein [Gaertneriomyces semiglobifer]